jgi:trk system potassium uptake protein TrkA
VRVAIAGAGAVGRSIAEKLTADGHKVLLIERERTNYRPHLVPDADWLLADACEVGVVERAGIHTCDVVVAAAGDDKVNLVFSLLAKTECGVARVVARVNHPKNRWMFTPAWGVDVAVSTPTALVSLVEEAVSVGKMVQVMTLQQGKGSIFAVTLPPETPLAGRPVTGLAVSDEAALLTIRRAGTAVDNMAEVILQAGDEIVFVATADVEARIRRELIGEDLPHDIPALAIEDM